MPENEQRTLQDKFMLRLPDGMRDRIRAAAETHGRSMNAEIVQTLERAYPQPSQVENITAELNRLIEELNEEDDAEKRSEIILHITVMNDTLQYLLQDIFEEADFDLGNEQERHAEMG
jgi:plasmid stability protein